MSKLRPSYTEVDDRVVKKTPKLKQMHVSKRLHYASKSRRKVHAAPHLGAALTCFPVSPLPLIEKKLVKEGEGLLKPT